ncbi:MULTISPECIES: manganese-dependent inorganic pyrophosphatase [Enterobacterales]|uniref:manganese-dependent inorganic pyrophosphatase n=1 Tax=Enterobacterales TaxID=91347 RepID=UPI001A11FAA6|nr:MULTISPECIES: manganese-dependent inorganic pyrophosphatase [Enterobacterales]EGX8121496.1 manganese-dependent inorganic pyrophosphatase [Salmonella enterica subsp. enterica serovar Cerro]EJL6819963.1 manganese-dependent inorganic pyrophosphatase [Salmonella enterica]EKK7721351.1 manganese-dependent inorganic pyrophosphatase [Cronobacter sakazakii]MDM4169454.1 manganese-dependent inorganic pyrophosphatase [Klebsiella michiganensis]EGQ5302340.1 manganese-dependent inorganic pyrophosphatase [
MIYVFGHQNPDSDSICSALVTADWLTMLGKSATPFRQGEITPETAFILQQAGVAPPRLLDEDLSEKQVWLVDFTDAEQGPPSLALSNIVGIIDHHRLGTVMTQNPPDVWIRAVGCCATILWQILSCENQLSISTSQATLMLGAIVSDTVALSSPTTTVHDIAAVKALIPISKLNYDHFVKGLLAAKTDIRGQSPHTLLMKDAKRYQINGLSVLLSQIEVATMSEVDSVLSDLLTALEEECQSGGIDIAAFAVTDIFQKNSTLYFSENNALSFVSLSLPGVISRKKDILPWLTSALSTSPR